MAMLLLCGDKSGNTNIHQSEQSSSSSSNLNHHCSSRTMVEQEENRIRTSKKPKQKKIPQRGLGVAQLEKIRLEEQQKKEAFAGSVPACPYYISPLKSHTFLHTNSVFSVSNLQHQFSPSFTQNLNNPSEIDSFSSKPRNGFLLFPSFGDQSNQNHGTEIPKMENFGFCSSNSDSTRLDLGSSSLTRKNSILLNKPILPSSSQMEPPSNQSYNSNSNIGSSWIDEERIVGMKRPRAFFNPFHGRSPCLSDSYYRSQELAPQDPLKSEPGNTIFGDNSYCSSSTSMAVQINWKSPSSSESDVNITKESVALDGAFLTLGPSHSFSNCNQTSTFSHQNFSIFDFFQSQEIVGEMRDGGVFLHSEPHQQPLYGFMDGGSNDRAMVVGKRRAREGGSEPFIDLNLKL